jgi:hypothetical protein
MKTRELQTLWWDWLGTAERLLRSLHEQTAALTLRNLERIEQLQPEIDSLLEQVRQIDDQAAACAQKLAADLGASPNLRSLAQALEQSEAQQVQALANRIVVAARNVQAVLDKNRALIENELTYVNGTLTLIAKAEDGKQTRYRRAPQRAAVLMDQAV